jgi:hypothetical protein
VLPLNYQGSNAIDFNILPFYLRTAWVEGFAPAVFGVEVPKAGATVWHQLAVDLVQVATFAAVAVTIARRRAAWRAWALLALMFVINAVAVLPRVTTYGIDIAHVTRYYTETAFVVPFAIAFAFVAPRSSRERATTQLRLPRGATAAWAIGALATYIGLVAWGDHETVQSSPGRQVRPWVKRVQAGLDRARRIDPSPVLLDGAVPRVVATEPPANRLSTVVPTFEDGVRFNEVAAHTYTVGPDGTVGPVVFVPAFGSTLAAIRASGDAALTGGTWRRQGAMSCVVAGPHPAVLRLEPPKHLSGHPWWLRAGYATRAAFGLPLRSDIGFGYGRRPSGVLPAATVGTGRLVAIPRLSNAPTFVGIEITVPSQATACFGQLAIGWFRPTPGARSA